MAATNPNPEITALIDAINNAIAIGTNNITPAHLEGIIPMVENLTQHEAVAGYHPTYRVYLAEKPVLGIRLEIWTPGTRHELRPALTEHAWYHMKSHPWNGQWQAPPKERQGGESEGFVHGAVRVRPRRFNSID